MDIQNTVENQKNLKMPGFRRKKSLTSRKSDPDFGIGKINMKKKEKLQSIEIIEECIFKENSTRNKILTLEKYDQNDYFLDFLDNKAIQTFKTKKTKPPIFERFKKEFFIKSEKNTPNKIECYLGKREFLDEKCFFKQDFTLKRCNLRSCYKMKQLKFKTSSKISNQQNKLPFKAIINHSEYVYATPQKKIKNKKINTNIDSKDDKFYSLFQKSIMTMNKNKFKKNTSRILNKGNFYKKLYSSEQKTKKMQKHDNSLILNPNQISYENNCFDFKELQFDLFHKFKRKTNLKNQTNMVSDVILKFTEDFLT